MRPAAYVSAFTVVGVSVLFLWMKMPTATMLLILMFLMFSKEDL